MSLVCWLRGHSSIRATSDEGERIFLCTRCGHTEPIIDRTGQTFVPRPLVMPTAKPASKVTPIRRAK